MEKTYDLLSIGRCGVDLYGDQWGSRLEEVSSFSKSVGGCPANIAIGTARLGLRVAMITRVGDEQMGRYVCETMAAEGIDTSYIISDNERLTTVVFLSIRDEQTFPLLFYRQNCADMALCEADIKEEAIARSRAILLSGVHLSTPSTAKACFAAIRLAKKHKSRIIFDIDYRPTLWGLTGLGEGESRYVESAEVTQNIQTLLPECDLIVGTEEEFNIAGGSQTIHKSLEAVRSISSAVFVYKMGAQGCCVVPDQVPKEFQPTGRPFAVKILNTIGAGDGFMSGFLRGYLTDQSWETCATWGNAAGALVVTRHACSPESPSWEELQFFLDQHSKLPSRPDEDSWFRHLHHATNRHGQWHNLRILAFDHRIQLETMARAAKKPMEAICHAKGLIFQAFRQLVEEQDGQDRGQNGQNGPNGRNGGQDGQDRGQNGQDRGQNGQNGPNKGGEFGLLCDHLYGEDILREAPKDWWVARPVEKPQSRPIDFDFTTDLSEAVRHFPTRHIVKCLFFHHSRDHEELRRLQLRRIRRLYDICMATRHELLLELIPPPTMDADELEVSRGMEQVYKEGIFPAWWKLAAFPSQVGWEAVAKILATYDEHCRGVLLLGLAKDIQTLQQEFALAAKQQCCKGFAIGRSIFAKPCESWFNGNQDDDTTIKEIKQNFTKIINYWESCRSENY